MILDIAWTHGNSATQVIVLWHLELDHSIILQSVTATRIRENGEIFDFSLRNAEMARISTVDTGTRGGPPEIVYGPER